MSLDVTEIATKVRYFMGDPDTDTISDSKLQYICQLVLDDIGDDDDMECEVVYQSLLKSLIYLSNKYQADATTTGTTSKRKEVKGKRSIEVDYDTDANTSDNAWSDLYTDYLAHPDWVCSNLVDTQSSGVVLIGGTKQDEYHSVKNNRNNRNPMSLNINRDYKFNRSKRGTRGSYWEL